ncbi:MAG: preprotein translocase subunit SecG [Zoogloeaceae bacterium]|jgi:preprotein translocase subunit SecG|nr:preprotein translocase subunit SecG [Zoogloeaceae bacterium]
MNWNWLYSLFLVVHVLAAAGIIFLVLMQHGKGADMGAAFGGGTSGSLFGASGSANFFSRSTGVLATIFFLTCLALGYTATYRPQTSGSVMQGVIQSAPVDEPAATTPVEPVPVGSGPAAGQQTESTTNSAEEEIPR